jgi:hypothetical protein
MMEAAVKVYVCFYVITVYIRSVHWSVSSRNFYIYIFLGALLTQYGQHNPKKCQNRTTTNIERSYKER